MNQCLECKSNTQSPRFCSRSCSVRYNNRLKPKRQAKQRKCSQCNVSYVWSESQTTRCAGCNEKHRLKPKFEDRTLQSLFDEFDPQKHHPSWKFSTVRQHCRDFNSHLPQCCQFCGYDFHVEMAHIQPVSTFPMTALVREVNHESNILVLCRNHHWEFDHGKLLAEQIPSR